MTSATARRRVRAPVCVAPAGDEQRPPAVAISRRPHVTASRDTDHVTGHDVRYGTAERFRFPPAASSLVVLDTAVVVSRPKFCGLGLGLEALVSAAFETDQLLTFISNVLLNYECWYSLIHVFKL